jgi:hypothetical protein
MAAPGVVNFTNDERWSASRCSASHDHWNPSHIEPCAEGSITDLTVFTGRQAVTAKLKVVVDPSVIGQETLGVTG